MMTAMGRALRGMLLLGGVGMLFIVVALWHPAPVAAATFTVTDNSDNPTDTGSLRFAVNDLAPGSNTITFAAPLTGGQTITLTSTLTLTNDVTISGPTSGAGVTVSGNNAVRVFTVNGGVTASITNLTIANGSSGGGNGGGINNSGTLTVTNSTLTGNSTSGGFGGGIANQMAGHADGDEQHALRQLRVRHWRRRRHLQQRWDAGGDEQHAHRQQRARGQRRRHLQHKARSP